jgi:hypothetical protein
VRIHRAPGRFFPRAYCAPEEKPTPQNEKALSPEEQDRIAYASLERAYAQPAPVTSEQQSQLREVIQSIPKRKRHRVWGLGPKWGRFA